MPAGVYARGGQGVAMSRHRLQDGWTPQAWRFALDPTPTQARSMASHVGAARFAYNWGLGLVGRRLDERARLREEVLVGGASQREADALAATIEVPWGLYALRREWNAAKATVAPWWPANSKEAYSSGLDGLGRALRAYFDSASGRRSGAKVGWPRPKRRRSRASCRFTTGGFRVVDAHHVRLPRIGVVRTHEPTTKLTTALSDGTARILSATLSVQAGRWFVSFGCKVAREPCPPPQGPTIGVDVGVGCLAVISTGQRVPNPRAAARCARAMARRSRECSRRQRGSRRHARSAAALARTHARMACVRRDAMHKLTTGLARNHGTVAVEHLAVANLLASPPAHLQVPVVRLHARGGRHLLPQLQDVLGMRPAKAKPVAVAAVVRVREPRVSTGGGPGRQLVAQPEGTGHIARYREWPGNLPLQRGERAGRGEVAAWQQAVLLVEPRSRHRLGGAG